MKGNLKVIVMFMAGCLAGLFLVSPDADLHTYSLFALYALMFQVGIAVGSHPTLRQQLRRWDGVWYLHLWQQLWVHLSFRLPVRLY